MAAEANPKTFLTISKPSAQTERNWIALDLHRKSCSSVLDEAILSADKLAQLAMMSGADRVSRPGAVGVGPYHIMLHYGFDEKLFPAVHDHVVANLNSVKLSDFKLSAVYSVQSNPKQTRFVCDVLCPPLQKIADGICALCDKSYTIPLYVTLRVVERVQLPEQKVAAPVVKAPAKSVNLVSVVTGHGGMVIQAGGNVTVNGLPQGAAAPLIQTNTNGVHSAHVTDGNTVIQSGGNVNVSL